MRKIQNRHIKIAVTAVVAGAILYAIMSIIDNIGLVYESVCAAVSFVLRVLSPVLIGFVIAFLLSRPSDFFERLIMRIKFLKKRRKAAHGIGVLLAFIIFVALIVLFLYIMVPGIIESVGSITQEIPNYAQSVDGMLGDLSRNESVSQVLRFVGIDPAQTSSISSIISRFWTDIAAFVQNATGYIFGFLVNTGLFLYNLVSVCSSQYICCFLKTSLKRSSEQCPKAFFAAGITG